MATADTDTPPRTHFLSLPQEIRDMVYLYFRPYRWVTITEMPDELVQPTISQVSRLVRRESLDVFYGKNRFMLDMRGWKNSSYPKSWTPVDIFNNWMAAIGDENAARIRSISFYLHNFAVHFNINPDSTPSITSKFRPTRRNSSYIDVAEDAPAGYSFDVAIKRAENWLNGVLGDVIATAQSRLLSSQDFLLLCSVIENLQPTLCTRIALGWKGAVMSADPTVPPNIQLHRSSCGECGHHRLSASD